MHTTTTLETDTASAILDMYRPAFVPLARNLTAAAFPLMKAFPAEYCVRRALASGAVTPATLVVETSSGTMAYGLAVVCALRRLSLAIVTDPVCDARLVRKLEALGARVDVVREPAAIGGYQRARLDRLEAIRAEHPDSWWVNQYDNPANAASYASVAADLIDRVGRIDCLVGTVGSGGSMSGLAAHLRLVFPELEVVGVDTYGSVLFGQPDRPRKLRGLGNSLVPGNLDHTLFDEVHWVSACEAFAATRALFARTTLFQGPTSGAAWLVAQWRAERNPDARVVCVFPDTGERYVDTVYDDRYLAAERLLCQPPATPVPVSHPREAQDCWTVMSWNRRTLEQVHVNER